MGPLDGNPPATTGAEGRAERCLEVSLREAQVREGEEAAEPGDDPGDVDHRRWLVGEEGICRPRPATEAGGGKEI